MAGLTLESAALGGIVATFVPEAGMICCSLRHRGEELLGQRAGLRKYVESRSTMGIPFLHPWANRLGASVFEVAGREVNLDLDGLPLKRDANGLPMHGLLSAAPGWVVDRHAELDGGGLLAASFDFGAYPRLLEAFPFPHRVEIEATLEGATLKIATTVEATGDVAVPIAFGFHPYLCLPGVPRADWVLEAPVGERLLLDERGLPTGEREPVEIEPGPVGERIYDDAFVAPAASEPFALEGGGRRIELRLGDGYPFTQIYAPGDTDAVAIEPMTAPTNALVVGGADLPLVEPGERLKAVWSLTLVKVT
ncbi:MAG: aldose 1-epimerase [Thermoleophilia bacterium]|nr:aldose 1-epimerase [Thermoleophilia bacterium]